MSQLIQNSYSSFSSQLLWFAWSININSHYTKQALTQLICNNYDKYWSKCMGYFPFPTEQLFATIPYFYFIPNALVWHAIIWNIADFAEAEVQGVQLGVKVTGDGDVVGWVNLIGACKDLMYVSSTYSWLTENKIHFDTPVNSTLGLKNSHIYYMFTIIIVIVHMLTVCWTSLAWRKQEHHEHGRREFRLQCHC